MSIFLILGITILILITIVIIQSNKKKETPTTQPPTTQPPACTKYKYNTSCLDNCGDKFVDEDDKKCYDTIPTGKYADSKTLVSSCGEKFVDETEKKCYDTIPDGKYADRKILLDNCGDKYVNETEKTCYDTIPDGKYADGKTLLTSCGESQTNKIVKGNMCVNTCDEFLHEPQDETLYGECKSTCDSYYIQSTLAKLCLNASELNSIFDFDNVKINDDFSKFIINLAGTPKVFYQSNNEKSLISSAVNVPSFIDLKMSSSGSVYARVYKTNIEILVQDPFNPPVVPKHNISIPQSFIERNLPLNTALGYEIEDFNFCGEDGVRGALSQAIIILKSTVPNQQGKLKKVMYILVIRDNNYELLPSDQNAFPDGEYNETNGEMFNMHKPVYLGTSFENNNLRQDLFGICFSFTNPGLESYLYYRQFSINYYSSLSTTSFIILGTLPIYDFPYNGTYQYINAKPTKNTITALRLYTGDTNNTIDIIKLEDNYYIGLEFDTTPNVVSNIAVGSTITITDNTTYPYQSKEIVYYVTRDNSVLKLNKYKYIKTQSVSSLPDPNITNREVAYEFPPVSNSNAYAYLTSNSDGSILTIGIHDGDKKNLYKYNEVSNTVEQLF